MCAVAGVFLTDGSDNAASIVYKMLLRQQNRGQEFSGIVSWDETAHRFHAKKKPGLVRQVYTESDLNELKGHIAVGHNRYSTAGASDLVSSQPHWVTNPHICVAANGDIVPSNYKKWRCFLDDQGAYFNSNNDGELITKYLAYLLQKRTRRGQPTWSFEMATKQLMKEVIGAFSAVGIYYDDFSRVKFYAWRDPLGMRPLVLGKIDNGFVVASETAALDIVGAKLIEHIGSGEIHCFDQENPKIHSSFHLVDSPKKAHCIFELIYFSRIGSSTFNCSVYNYRKELGRLLARRHPVDADVVFCVPNSSRPVAIGFAEESGIRFEEGFDCDYISRTFITAGQSHRVEMVRQKLNPIRSTVEGKRCVVPDDSIVRATTTGEIVRMLKEYGAKEVHVRIAAPPITHSCHYGIDTPDPGKLIAAQKTVEGICEFIDADTLGYNSLADLGTALMAVGGDKCDFCDACFSGQYPTVL